VHGRGYNPDMEMKMPKITPFLWFDNQAEEAARFYTSIFKNSKLGAISRSTEAGPGPAGSVLTVSFELEGIEYTALNDGPNHNFTDAISFTVHCETQQEVDYYWEKLGAGGREVACGWLTDKYGLSWQITPIMLMKLLGDPDKAKAGRVMQAMLKMVKLDIAKLEAAARG
jgi:predicted 3-demethylubiquinone-9 3-methyltransferase (glyoxalase superfamily)